MQCILSRLLLARASIFHLPLHLSFAQIALSCRPEMQNTRCLSLHIENQSIYRVSEQMKVGSGEQLTVSRRSSLLSCYFDTTIYQPETIPDDSSSTNTGFIMDPYTQREWDFEIWCRNGRRNYWIFELPCSCASWNCPLYLSNERWFWRWSEIPKGWCERAVELVATILNYGDSLVFLLIIGGILSEYIL